MNIITNKVYLQSTEEIKEVTMRDNDCIDRVVLLLNKVKQRESGKIEICID
jgi:hypothetical protein